MPHQSFTAGRLLDQAFTSGRLLDQAFTSGRLLDQAFTSGRLLDQPLTAGRLLDQAVGAVQAADAATISSTLATNIVLVVVVAALVAAGVYLLLDRSLVRVLLGTVLIGNGVSILFLVAGGRAGQPPFFGTPPTQMSDPLPQAMVLTAIVISLGTIGFLMALAYRLWQLSGTDNVPDDIEDARLQELADLDEPSTTFDVGEEPTTTSDELAQERP